MEFVDYIHHAEKEKLRLEQLLQIEKSKFMANEKRLQTSQSQLVQMSQRRAVLEDEIKKTKIQIQEKENDIEQMKINVDVYKTSLEALKMQVNEKKSLSTQELESLRRRVDEFDMQKRKLLQEMQCLVPNDNDIQESCLPIKECQDTIDQLQIANKETLEVIEKARQEQASLEKYISDVDKLQTQLSCTQCGFKANSNV